MIHRYQVGARGGSPYFLYRYKSRVLFVVNADGFLYFKENKTNKANKRKAHKFALQTPNVETTFQFSSSGLD